MTSFLVSMSLLPQATVCQFRHRSKRCKLNAIIRSHRNKITLSHAKPTTQKNLSGCLKFSLLHLVCKVIALETRACVRERMKYAPPKCLSSLQCRRCCSLTFASIWLFGCKPLVIKGEQNETSGQIPSCCMCLRAKCLLINPAALALASVTNGKPCLSRHGTLAFTRTTRKVPLSSSLRMKQLRGEGRVKMCVKRATA